MKKTIFIYMLIFSASIVLLITLVNIIGILGSSTSTFNSKSTPNDSTTVKSNSITSQPPNNKNKKYIVALDAGHGGSDPGSIGAKGTMEKDITLSVTLKLGQILEKKDIKVIYTRKDDNVSWSSKKNELLARAEASNKNNANIFVSIHVNSSDYRDIMGTETYYNKVSSSGKKLASLIQSSIVNEVKLKDRGIKSENFSVLKNVEAPSVLVELGYISNGNEEYLLNSLDYQNRIALAIANGIMKHFQ